ncbi:potassium channel family protein [Nocardia farcinica]|uniref:potassium channel family protein n=1 Tax=Nocardia farcinica TaxID=37329 RepID=UPI0018946099|nr:potassium channel family protein [Nocardia farcinica]MBF6251555.1 potassium channel family protein [Nocardia farcinica]
MTESPELTRRQVWERATNVPMLVLAVVFIAVYAWHVLDTGASPRLDAWLTWIDVVIWALFAADFLIRAYLSTDRLRFVRTHPLDLLIVVVPPFRPLRLLRAALLLLGTFQRSSITRPRLAVFVGASSVLILLLGSLAFFDAEYGASDSKIDSYGDALWWAAVTVTTVGYGDIYPVTAEGRLVSLILMTFGIGLISFAIGTATSWVMDQLKTVEASQERTDREIGGLLVELKELRAEVAALRDARSSPGAGNDGAVDPPGALDRA